MNENFSKWSKFKDIGRWYVTRFIEKSANEIREGSLILDAGAGECVYKKYFTHCRYRAVDLAVGENSWNYNNLDFIARLDSLPVKDTSFDAVICTQTLEHLEWPCEAVKEFYRLLKQGGSLYITVPMAHVEHQAPYDFFRYTSYGINSILKHAGFREEDIKIKPFGGICMRLASEIPRLVGIFNPKNKPLSSFLLIPVRLMIKVLQLMLMWLDRFDDVRTDPLGWSVEAKK